MKSRTDIIHSSSVVGKSFISFIQMNFDTPITFFSVEDLYVASCTVATAVHVESFPGI